MRTAPDVSLVDLLNEHKRQIQIETNCHAIGEIQSFNSQDQTCSIKVNYKKTKMVQGSTGAYQKTFIDYPILIDCPVIILSGGQSGISFPISVGDDCLVLFNDRDINNWFAGEKNTELESNRLHSLSDGIALVGLKSLNDSLENYDEENVHIFNEDSGIRVKPSKIELYNSTDKLGLLLRELIDTIKGLTTLPVVSGSPATLSATTISALEATAVKIEGLLE